MFWARLEFIVARLLEFGSFSSRYCLSPKRVGQIGERLACAYLRDSGYKFIEKNYRSDRGEIDLIMTDSNELVFVEVKTRQSIYGASFVFDSISKAQQAKLSATGRRYLSERLGKKWRGKYRFDAIGVILVNERLASIRVLKRFL